MKRYPNSQHLKPGLSGRQYQILSKTCIASWMCFFEIGDGYKTSRFLQLFTCGISWVGAFGAFKQRVENCVVGIGNAMFGTMIPPQLVFCQCSAIPNIWGPGVAICPISTHVPQDRRLIELGSVTCIIILGLENIILSSS